MRQLRKHRRQTIVVIMNQMSVKPVLIVVLVAGSLSGCGLMNRLKPAPIVAPVAEAVVLPAMGVGQNAAALDQSSDAEKAAALTASVGVERSLGTVVVGLGSPAEQGFWIKSPLIATAGKGRVELKSGASVNVDLLPGTGGALLSLAAFRALGLGLTDLPEVTIYAQ
jgi:hypothetical protein